MPGTRASVKNEKQYEALKDKGMSKERAAKISAIRPAPRREVGKASGSGTRRSNSSQGGTTAPEARGRPQGWEGQREEELTAVAPPYSTRSRSTP